MKPLSMHREKYWIIIMKEWAHLILAITLWVTTLSISLVTQTNENIRPLDTSRFYTMRRAKPDTASALHQLKDLRLWTSDSCQALTNLSTDTLCIEMREELRNNILKHMQCTKYGSQACSYTRLALKALVRVSSTERVDPEDPTSAFKVYGSNLKTITTPNGGTFKDIIQGIINEAPKLFHGGFRAEESNNTLVLRSALYNLITIAILGNLIMQIAESFDLSSTMRVLARSSTFILVFLAAFVYLLIHQGNALVFSLILVTAFVNLVYFEMFLDPTIIRPWIHPFTFSVVYMSSAVLALVENGILDYNLIVVHTLMSMAACQMFMSMTWYFVGISEKMRLTDPSMLSLHQVYLTKETQLALLGSILLQIIIPLQQVMAPYDYTYKSLFLAMSPVIFAVLSVLSVVAMYDMSLDDEYGTDRDLKGERKGWEHNQQFATTITGTKLYTSMLLLLYGTVFTMILVWDHIQTYRAYLGAMPEDSIQFDLRDSRKYLIGQGLNVLSVL